MKVLLRPLAAVFSLVARSAPSETKAREAQQGSDGVYPTAPPPSDLDDGTQFSYYQPPPYTPFDLPPPYSPPYLQEEGEESLSLNNTVKEGRVPGYSDAANRRNARARPGASHSRRRRPPQRIRDESSTSDDGFLFVRYGDSSEQKDAVGHLQKQLSSCLVTTDKESNLYTVYDIHLEQTIPIMERYFAHPDARADLLSRLDRAHNMLGRAYASPCGKEELFPSFLPCSRLLEKLKDTALPSARMHMPESNGVVSRIIGYINFMRNTQEKIPSQEQVQSDGPAIPLQDASDAFDAIRSLLVQSHLINSTEFLPFAEISSMLIRVLDCLKIGGAFRRPKTFKQALCSMLKMNFFAAKLLKLHDGLAERNAGKAEENRFRYNFFKARLFETLKEFNLSCLACLENITPEYIDLNAKNSQYAYYAFSTLRCFNSMAKLMTTLLNIGSHGASSRKTVKRDIVFVSSTLVLYTLEDHKDASIAELLSADSLPSGLQAPETKPYSQAFGREFRPEGDALGDLLPSSMAEHRARMRELESELQKKITAAFKSEKRARALRSPGGPRRSNDRKDFKLADYLCELVLEVTGQNITHVKATDAVSADSLEALLYHALSSPEHYEIGWILFAGPVLRTIFEAVDNDYGTRTTMAFKRLSVDDESYRDLPERLRSEGSFFISMKSAHLNRLTVRHCILEDRCRLLKGALFMASGFALILSVLAYLYLRRSHVTEKSM